MDPSPVRTGANGIATDVADGRLRADRITLRTVVKGAEWVALRQRRVRVEPDVYVISAGGYVDADPVEVDTRPLVVELAVPDDGRALPEFLPTLRSMDGAVGRALRALGAGHSGACPIAVPSEAAPGLWAELVAEERALRARAERIDCTKPSTRQSLFRRLLLSADFIHGNYAEPLRVDALAEVSNLSPYHFTRLFGVVMDATPHAFLVRKRVVVARRLLAAGVGRGEAAVRAGFGCRSTLFRHLRTSASRPT